MFKFLKRSFLKLIGGGRKKPSNSIINLPLRVRQIAQLVKETYKSNRTKMLNHYRLV